MTDRGKKIIIGAKLKRLRKGLGLTQAQMARELDVSPSYITLIEANQRPVSAQLLVKLSQIYDFSPGGVDDQSEPRLRVGLETAFKDPVLGGSVSKTEIEDVVGASPAITRGLLLLYDKYRALVMSAHAQDSHLATRETAELLEQTPQPVEEVRNHFHVKSNHFSSLDQAAEDLAEELEIWRHEPQIVLSDRLREKFGYEVKLRKADFFPGKFRLFDPHRKQLNLSEQLDQSARRFQIAVMLARIEFAKLIEAEVKDANFSQSAQPLARESYANYFAAAFLMPYTRFLKEAENERYDIQVLCQRFGASYEQVAHRLTTLQRPSARGVPFFFVRVDQAGNVSKRFSAGRFHFSKFGGSCPLWNIHNCFEAPDRVHSQVLSMPDGTTYFSIAKSVLRHGATYTNPAGRVAIGLGCDVAYAPRLIYSSDLNMDAVAPVEIGLNCYLCERPNCASRSSPPLSREFTFSDRVRGVSSFQFSETAFSEGGNSEASGKSGRGRS